MFERHDFVYSKIDLFTEIRIANSNHLEKKMIPTSINRETILLFGIDLEDFNLFF